MQTGAETLLSETLGFDTLEAETLGSGLMGEIRQQNLRLQKKGKIIGLYRGDKRG